MILDWHRFEERGGGRSWRPPPFVLASFVLHVACLVALVFQPESWQWILGALACNQFALLAAVLMPRSNLLGPNLQRLPQTAARLQQVALTFDDGPDPDVTPQVLDLLDRYAAKASFFCVGEKAAAYPRIVREIARRGHSVENHSYRHSYGFALYGFFRLHRDISTAQAVIAGICGRLPVFFRAPAGFRSPFLDPILASNNLHYVSWTRRGYDAVLRDPAQILQRLVRGLAAGDVLMLHDGSGARTRAGVPVVLAVLPDLLDRLAAANLHSVSLPTACNADLPAQTAAAAALVLHSERQTRHA